MPQGAETAAETRLIARRFKPVIDGWLRDDLDAPRKQRHTATRIYDRLLDDHAAASVVSYATVRDYLATRRRQVRIEAGRELVNTFIPQTRLPGHEAEVDFGEVVVRPRGELVTCTLFGLRLPYSGKAEHRISASAGQEAFFEGHAHGFQALGGVCVPWYETGAMGSGSVVPAARLTPHYSSARVSRWP